MDVMTFRLENVYCWLASTIGQGHVKLSRIILYDPRQFYMTLIWHNMAIYSIL